MNILKEARERAEQAGEALRAAREKSRAEKAERMARRDADELAAAQAQHARVYVMPRQYVAAAHAISWIATISVLYFLWLYCVDEAKDVATPMLLSRAGIWTGSFAFYFPLLAGFVAISIAVALCCKYWISFYVLLSYKRPGEGWPKFWTLVLGLLTSAVVVLGSFSIMQGGRIEGHRDEVVAEQRLDANRSSLQARLDAVNTDLREALGPEDLARPSTQMQACRNTQATWRIRAQQARRQGDAQADQIERAISDAVRCDELRAARVEIMGEIAALPVDAQVQGRVVAERDRAIAGAVDGARNVRSITLSVTADMLAILFAWIALRLDQVRQFQLIDAARAAAKEPPAPASAEPTPTPPAEPIDELDLPALADWRGDVDEAFAVKRFMVDEGGRRMKRVRGHYRVDDDRAPPTLGADRDLRRPQAAPIDEPPPANEPHDGAGEPSADIDDLIARMTAEADAPSQTPEVVE